MRRVEASPACLAVWWKFGDSFIGAVEPLDGPDVVQYGNTLQLAFDHFQIWDEFNPLGFGAEYDELPRGRVMFRTDIHKFVVIGPRMLMEDDAFRSKVLMFFGLPATTVFEWDEHYG